MGAGTAAGTSNIEVGSIIVGYDNHVAFKIDNATVGICDCVVKELVDGNEGGCDSSCLLGSNLTVVHQQIGVYGSCVIEESSEN